MRTRFDQIGKQLAREALAASGATFIHDEIVPEVQYSDIRHEPAPEGAEARAQLGLLGRIASTRCQIELFGHAPSAGELRACLGKHIALTQLYARLPERHALEGAEAPFLWIVAAGTPRTLLASFPFAPAQGWPRGVYLLDGPVLRVGLVAAAELPRDRSTVLVRLMAGGALLPGALADLRELPQDAYERVVAEPVLVRLKHALVSKRQRAVQEEETLMDIYSTWEEVEAELMQQGSVQTQTRDVLTVLRVRGIAVSDEERARVLGETDLERLERWLERAVTAASVAEVFAEPH